LEQVVDKTKVEPTDQGSTGKQRLSSMWCKMDVWTKNSVFVLKTLVHHDMRVNWLLLDLQSNGLGFYS